MALSAVLELSRLLDGKGLPSAITARSVASIGDRGSRAPVQCREHDMSHYRAYLIRLDGEFKSVIELDCANDNSAVESAMQLVDRCRVELWQNDRLVRRLKSN